MARQLRAIPSTLSWESEGVGAVPAGTEEGPLGLVTSGRGGRGRDDFAGDCVLVGAGCDTVDRGVAPLEELGIVTLGWGALPLLILLLPLLTILLSLLALLLPLLTLLLLPLPTLLLMSLLALLLLPLLALLLLLTLLLPELLPPSLVLTGTVTGRWGFFRSCFSIGPDSLGSVNWVVLLWWSTK